MKAEPNVILYIVELAYKGQKFYVTDEKNQLHLQIYSETAPIWHKENMINMGVRALLPTNWKAFAWIDADLEFESTTWAMDTLKVLNGSRDIVQIFSHALDLDQNENIMQVFSSFGFQYAKGKKHDTKLTGANFWHPGFAWAMTRELYEKIGGLYELSILGSGDHNMALSIIGNGGRSVNEKVDPNYKTSVLEFQEKIKDCKFGYVPGVIRHYFHGTKANRKYVERWTILVKHKYDPINFVTRNSQGLLIPTEKCPQELLDAIWQYFVERNEDDFLIKDPSSEKPCEKPPQKPQEKPQDKPCEKPCEKPPQKPQDKPCEKPPQKPQDKPCEKPPQKPQDKPQDKPCEKPPQKPQEKPQEKPQDKPCEKSQEKTFIEITREIIKETIRETTSETTRESVR